MRKGNRFIYYDKPYHITLRHIIKKFLYPFVNSFYKVTYLLLPKRKQEKAKYTTSICAIFRNEAISLREWIEYHVIIGVDHFYLYNNLSDDKYAEILDPYIQSGLVTLNDWNDTPGQISAYKQWYSNYREETMWVSFLDLDEFICPIDDNDIKSWLVKRANYPVIQMYWRMFTSSGQLQHDKSRTSIEQYVVANDKLVNIGKVFYNTAFDIPSFPIDMMHRFSVKWRSLELLPVNEFGNVEWKGLSKYRAHNSIQVNHYWGRAYDLYIIKKLRGSATGMYQKTFDNYMVQERGAKIADYHIYKYLIPLKLKLGY